jgi:nucleoid-associated protein YgaU
MPNDAKLGLVVGVVLVIAIAVVFFRKEQAPVNPRITSEIRAPATKTVSANAGNFVRHTVHEGETLFSLALLYYKDDRRFVDIFEANRDVIPSPTQLTPGSVLIIPEVQPSR